MQTYSYTEQARLAALHRYAILDTPEEEVFDRFVDLASGIADMPISLITFVDGERQWIKARAGTDLAETPRDRAFCDQAIRSDEIMVVPDATKDARFADNPLVTSHPGIRFYVGAPLIVTIRRGPPVFDGLGRS